MGDSERPLDALDQSTREDFRVFKVIVREDKLDGGFNVSYPALPGCHSQGDTLDEVLKNIRDAIEDCLYVLN